MPRALHDEFRCALDDREDLEKSIREPPHVESLREIGRALHLAHAQFHGGGDAVKGIGLERRDEACGEPVRDPVVEFGRIDHVRLKAVECRGPALSFEGETLR